MSRQRLWLRQNTARNRLIPAADRLLYRQWVRQGRFLLPQTGTATSLVVLDDAGWRETLWRVWFSSGEVWWRHTVDMITAGKELDVAELREIRNNARGMRKIRAMAAAAAERIQSSVRRLLQREADRYDQQLRTVVRVLFTGDEARTAASRQARLQVLDATSVVAQEAAVATERELLKEWLSVQDDRVRATHSDADSRYRLGSDPGPIPLDAQFHVGAGFGLYPRDSSLPPEETYGCRCVARYVPAARTRPDRFR